MKVLAGRNVKEIIRDPLTLGFGLGFPLVLLLLLSMIQMNIPNPVFVLSSLTPGIAVFGLAFIALFSGMLIAKDRSSSFLMRLYAAPLTASDFILSYTLPLLPMAVLQSILCFLAAFLLGLEVTVQVLLCLVVLIPAALLFIGIGLLTGSLLNEKQVGGICGALVTNLTAWLSGAWFDPALVGGAFEALAKALPFYRATQAARAALAGDYAGIMPHLWWVIAYAAVIMALAIFAFNRKMQSEKA